MWRSIKRWRDWAMHELASGTRPDGNVAGLHFGYEKSGLRVRDQAIPWNAETVFVEAELPACGSVIVAEPLTAMLLVANATQLDKSVEPWMTNC